MKTSEQVCNLSTFAGAPDTACEDINAWVAEQTENHIRDIVPENAITPATRYVLANAIWFLGAWERPFKGEKTHTDSFFLTDGTSVPARFMTDRFSLGYKRGDGYQAVTLPYQNQRYEFIVLLPDAGKYSTFEAAFQWHKLVAMTQDLAWRPIDLYLPRFEMRFDTSLVQDLGEMGVADAFDPYRADFSGHGIVPARPTAGHWRGVALGVYFS